MLEGATDNGGIEELKHYTNTMGDRFRDLLKFVLKDDDNMLNFYGSARAPSGDTGTLESSESDPPTTRHAIHEIVLSPSTKQSEHALKEFLLSEAQGGIRKQVPFADILLATTDIRPLDASQHFQLGLSLAKLCLYRLSQHHITMSSTPWDPSYHKLRATLSLPPVHSSLGSLAIVINNFENQIEKYILSGSLKSSAVTSSCESFDESSYVLAVLPLLHLAGYSAPRREVVFGHSPVAMPVLLGEFYQAMCPPPRPFIPLPKVGPGDKIGGGGQREPTVMQQHRSGFSSQSSRKLRIGVISGSFDVQSGRIIVGLFENIMDADAARARGRGGGDFTSPYELVALCFPTPRDKITDRARLLFHEHVNLDTANRKKTIQRIAKTQLDVIIFSDGGHDSRTFALAHYRLAPFQLMYWGWGGTLGIKTIDHYLYPEILWSPKSCVLSTGSVQSPQEQYSEQVVLLEGLPPYARVKDKESPYGNNGSATEVWEKFQKYLLLPPQNRSNLYLFPGSVRQFHPEMDLAISILLKTDPLAIIIFTTPLMGRDLLPPLHESVKNDLLHPVMPVAGVAQAKARLLPYVGEEALKRLRFLPPIDDKTFYLLRSHVVAVLDSFPVGMHVPILEAMAAGVPVVSAPKLQECTNSHAFGIAESFALGIAHDEAKEFWPRTSEEYAVLAMRLAREHRLRQLFIPKSSLMSDHGTQVLAFCTKLLGLH